MQSARSRRTGSTTVELVLLASIIVLVIALLIPVVQNAHESAGSGSVAQKIT